MWQCLSVECAAQGNAPRKWLAIRVTDSNHTWQQMAGTNSRWDCRHLCASIPERKAFPEEAKATSWMSIPCRKGYQIRTTHDQSSEGRKLHLACFAQLFSGISVSLSPETSRPEADFLGFMRVMPRGFWGFGVSTRLRRHGHKLVASLPGLRSPKPKAQRAFHRFSLHVLPMAPCVASNEPGRCLAMEAAFLRLYAGGTHVGPECGWLPLSHSAWKIRFARGARWSIRWAACRREARPEPMFGTSGLPVLGRAQRWERCCIPGARRCHPFSLAKLVPLHLVTCKLW